MGRHWHKKLPKSAETYRLQREAKRIAAEKGHTMGRFVRLSHGYFTAYCTHCPAGVAVALGAPEPIKTWGLNSQHPVREL